MKLLRWIVPAVSLAAVLAVTAWELRTTRTSPGPLHPAHASAAGLDGGAACERCHAAGEGLAATGCCACHVAIGDQLAAARGLHGSLPPARANDCGRCHPEHHGDASPLLAPHAFALAGVADVAAYDHAHVATFALDGAHRDLACTACHAHADDAAPPAGGRYLGLSQQCASCHDDAHAGAYGADCASCHGQQQPFAAVPEFRHERFALRDAHQRVQCDRCHAAGGPFAVDALRRTPPAQARGCGDCHDDPHAATAPAATARMPIADAGDCARCHSPTTFAAHAVTPAFHAGFGVLLRGAHETLACTTCHGDRERAPRWRGDAPAMADCAACHASPHRDQLLAPDRPREGACTECHDDADATFAAATVDARQHARVGFALQAPHDDVACTGCHANAQPFELRYPGRDAAACATCHADAHRGQFAGDPALAQCTACHAATHFVPSRFDVAAHDRSTFPLRWQHAAVACTRCHADTRDGARVFRGTPSRCVACHADPHGGRFDQARLPAAVGGRTDCARCHDEHGFRPVMADFDHGRWTGWPLTGAHGAVACAQCHPRLPAPDANGSRSGKAFGTRCADCHRDEHLGQFASPQGVTDCTTCHVTARWSDVRFDHQRDSRFALDDTHRGLQCRQCHRLVATPAGSVVRYKPLGVQCADCHGTPPRRSGR